MNSKNITKAVSAGSKLFPSVNEKDLGIFHYHKGHVAHFKTASGSSGSIPRRLSSHEKASGLARGARETVVKFDKAKQGIKTAQHLHAAADYVSRNGEVNLEDENGTVLSKDELDRTVDEWVKDQDIPATDEELIKSKKGTKRPADARRFIVSCPKGSDPDAVLKAARELGEEFFKANGFSYVFAIHVKDDEHPNEPDHPHVHFIIKAISKDGKRLNIRKADIQLMRERFAVLARKYGIDLNATNRTVRGNSQKSKTIERVYDEKKQRENLKKKEQAKKEKTAEEKKKAQEQKEHIRKRKSKENKQQSQAQKWAFKRGKDRQQEKAKQKQAAKDKKVHEYQQQRADEIKTAINKGENIKDHEGIKKAKKTREEVKENMSDYIKELKKSKSKEDQELAEKLEKYSKTYDKPIKSRQQTLLEKAREELRRKEQVKQKQQEKQR